MPASGGRATAAKPRRLSRTQRPDDLSTPDWQVALRRQYGREQPFEMKNLGEARVFSEFAVHNPGSGNTYRVAIRGAGLGDNLGDSRLARFMDSVERATRPPTEGSPPAQADPTGVAAGGRPPADEVADGRSRDRPEGAAGRGRDAWQPLLTFAQTLLAEFAQRSGQNEDGESDGLVRRDPRTGERYLHLPVPDEDKLTRLLDALRDVLGR